MQRCDWANYSELEVQYHDEEWGIPVHDDRQLFEMLTLEAAQAGLSWHTILQKRENYRKAFDHFDIEKVARYSPKKIETLLQDPGIIRNRLKVEATVNNAARILEIQQEFGSFDRYLWNLFDEVPVINQWQNMDQIPGKTALSDKLSKTLKKQGFKFIGSTICYAFMQATGMVNDHLTSCFRYSICRDALLSEMKAQR